MTLELTDSNEKVIKVIKDLDKKTKVKINTNGEYIFSVSYNKFIGSYDIKLKS